MTAGTVVSACAGQPSTPEPVAGPPPAAPGGEPAARIVPFLDVSAMTAEVIGLIDDPAARARLGERARAVVEERHVTGRAAPRLLASLAAVEPGLDRRMLDLRATDPTPHPEGLAPPR